MTRPRWDVLTGEYPPQAGGVADYTRLVALGLAARGCEVHVWTVGKSEEDGDAGGTTDDEGGVLVHRDVGRWSRPGLARLAGALGPPGRRRLLAEYAPNTWGLKGLNFGFCRWLAARGRGGDHVRVMFHELYYYTRWNDRPTRWPLPVLQRGMLRTVLGGCSRIDYATGEWGRLLARSPAARGRPMTWLPVPSNVPVVDDPDGVAAVRQRVAPRGEAVVGHFGTFSDDQKRRLMPAFPGLLIGRSDRVGLLIGRNSGRFAAEVVARHPELAGRITATGGLETDAVSRHLQACDVLIQPYPDGLCARRTTAMAGLAHGRAVASTSGSFTEPLFLETRCAALAPIAEPGGLARVAEELLGDPAERAALGARARASYDTHFAVGRTVDAILDEVP